MQNTNWIYSTDHELHPHHYDKDTNIMSHYLTLHNIDYYVECHDNWFENKDSILTIKNVATEMNEEDTFTHNELDEIATYVLNVPPYY